MMVQLKELWDHNFFKTAQGMAYLEDIFRRYSILSPEVLLKLVGANPKTLFQQDVPGSAIIVDDLLAYAKNPLVLLAYYMCILHVLQHHRVSIKLRKTRFLPCSAEFVGQDLLPHGNAPASSKFPAISQLT